MTDLSFDIFEDGESVYRTEAAPAQIEPLLHRHARISTRASIFLRKRMDCRVKPVKPGNDDRFNISGSRYNSGYKRQVNK
jgi:hypothetical protein